MQVDELLATLEERTGLEVHGRQRRRFVAAAEAVVGRRNPRQEVDESTLAEIVEAVTVNESYFFRDARQMELLRTHVLPAVGRGRDAGAVSVWCAGCASGEEAYTVAMLALEQRPQIPVRVLGTDLSADAIEAGRAARYGDWALRGVDLTRRRAWFVEDHGVFRPRDDVRRSVRLEVANLLDGPPGRFDLVVCRNLLMYLSQRGLAQAAEVLADAVVPDGWLLLGASDPPLPVAHLVQELTPYGLVYRHRRRQPAPPPPSSSPSASVTPTEPAEPASAEPTEPVAARPVRASPPAPGDPATSAARARRLADEGRGVEAIAAAADALRHQPYDPELHLLLAALHLQEGDGEAALDAARRASYLDPSLAVAPLVQGHALRQLGDPVGAGREFRRAERMFAEMPSDEAVTGGDGSSAGYLATVARQLAAQEEASRER